MDMITLKMIAGTWYAVSQDYVEVFGTDTIPTPFTSFAPVKQVIARIQALNPGKLVCAA